MKTVFVLALAYALTAWFMFSAGSSGRARELARACDVTGTFVVGDVAYTCSRRPRVIIQEYW